MQLYLEDYKLIDKIEFLKYISSYTYSRYHNALCWGTCIPSLVECSLFFSFYDFEF